MTGEQQYEENERRSRALNARDNYVPQRNPDNHCPKCGQYWGLHFAGVDCTRPNDYVGDYPEDEPRYNQFGELGYWAIRGSS